MSPQSPSIRPCTAADFDAMYAVINAAATAYAGVIPADRYQVPYMPSEELRGEIAAGVRFWGWFDADGLSGAMGIQDVDDVTLIRHAYVKPERQGAGIGSRLLAHLMSLPHQPLLVGTWADASWAIRFYERHGFRLVTPQEKDRLLRRYWAIPAAPGRDVGGAAPRAVTRLLVRWSSTPGLYARGSRPVSPSQRSCSGASSGTSTAGPITWNPRHSSARGTNSSQTPCTRSAGMVVPWPMKARQVVHPAGTEVGDVREVLARGPVAVGEVHGPVEVGEGAHGVDRGRDDARERRLGIVAEQVAVVRARRPRRSSCRRVCPAPRSRRRRGS